MDGLLTKHSMIQYIDIVLAISYMGLYKVKLGGGVGTPSDKQLPLSKHVPLESASPSRGGILETRI